MKITKKLKRDEPSTSHEQIIDMKNILAQENLASNNSCVPIPPVINSSTVVI